MGESLITIFDRAMMEAKAAREETQKIEKPKEPEEKAQLPLSFKSIALAAKVNKRLTTPGAGGGGGGSGEGGGWGKLRRASFSKSEGNGIAQPRPLERGKSGRWARLAGGGGAAVDRRALQSGNLLAPRTSSEAQLYGSLPQESSEQIASLTAKVDKLIAAHATVDAKVAAQNDAMQQQIATLTESFKALATALTDSQSFSRKYVRRSPPSRKNVVNGAASNGGSAEAKAAAPGCTSARRELREEAAMTTEHTPSSPFQA